MQGSDGLFELPRFLKCSRRAQEFVGALRFQSTGALMAGLRFSVLALLGENQRQMMVCLGGIGIQHDRLATTCFSFVEPPLFAEQIAQCAVGLGIMGAKLNGSSQAGFSSVNHG